MIGPESRYGLPDWLKNAITEFEKMAEFASVQDSLPRRLFREQGEEKMKEGADVAAELEYMSDLLP